MSEDKNLISKSCHAEIVLSHLGSQWLKSGLMIVTHINLFLSKMT